MDPIPNKEGNCKKHEMSLLDNSQGRKESADPQLTPKNDCSLSPHFPFNFLLREK